jgi:hypothetical protein
VIATAVGGLLSFGVSKVVFNGTVGTDSVGEITNFVVTTWDVANGAEGGRTGTGDIHCCTDAIGTSVFGGVETV